MPVSQPGKNASSVATGKMQSHFIIFGHAVGIKGLTLCSDRPFVQGIPSKRTAYACGRYRRAERLAHDHLLAVQFSKLIAIMTRNPARPFGPPRNDRQLDQGSTSNQMLEKSQRFGMHNILRIVEDDCRKIGLLFNFVATQGIPEMIETIRLGGRPRMLTNDQPDLVATAGCSCDRSNGLGIIGITADVNAILARCPLPQTALEHHADDRCLFPCRYKYRHSAFGYGLAETFNGCLLIA